MMNTIIENEFVERLVSGFRHSPRQLNHLQETDAEIIQLSAACTLAISTDSISEEIAAGLYTDPYLIGWMTVMANLSDIAAVGAQPIGLTISEILPDWCTHEFLVRLQEGIQDACTACDTFVLGGDTNQGEQLTLTGTAIGICRNGMYLSRVGCHPGDLLYATGHVGTGNAFGLATLIPRLNRIDYQPFARLRQGQSLVDFATACMDTSDGVIATLDQLMRLNNHGFQLNDEWMESLHPQARKTVEAAGVPPWLLLAGHHGEFELLFTVPPDRVKELNQRANNNHVQPLLLGTVTSEPCLTLPIDGKIVQLDTARIRNCGSHASGNLQQYLQELLNIDNDIRKGVRAHANH